jgi:hypothetical protein
MNKDYCCVRFRETVSRGTDRGLAIVPKRNPKFGDFFFLQFRAISEAHHELPFDTGNIPLTLSVEQAIQYCPWCGARLADVYSSAIFDELPYVEERAEP